MCKVIVIGGNHHNTLGVIRSLGRRRIFPDVILTSGGKTSFVLKSRYIKHSWVVTGSEAAIKLLLTKFKEEKEKPVIIACHDLISSQIDLNRERLSPFFMLPGCEIQGRVTELMNKQRMSELASKCGLNVPKTWIGDNRIMNEDQEFFPCITKPTESRNGSKSEIHVCHTAQQLHFFLEKSNGKQFLIQQFIEKEIEFQLIGCSLSAGKSIIIPGVSVILRQPHNTNTGFLQYRPLDKSFEQTLELTKRFIRATAYSGLFSVEFIRDKEGMDFFMEINFRNDGNSVSVTNAGVNLPYIWAQSCLGKDYSKEIKQIHEEYVMPEFAELDLYYSGLISFKQLPYCGRCLFHVCRSYRRNLK